MGPIGWLLPDGPGVKSMRSDLWCRLYSLESSGRPASMRKRAPSERKFVRKFVRKFSVTCMLFDYPCGALKTGQRPGQFYLSCDLRFVNHIVATSGENPKRKEALRKNSSRFLRP